MRHWTAVFLVLLVLAGCGPATETEVNDTYALLGPPQETYVQARPGKPLQFPADHGAHPAYRLEWWYLTANLQDAVGEPLGMQWTLFRQAMTPDPDRGGWSSNQFYMAHAAITDRHGHRAEERFARGGVGIAGVTRPPFRAWLDNWVMQSQQQDLFPMTLRFDVEGVQVTLQLSGEDNPVLHGDNGFSQKHPQLVHGSYYYSLPRIQVSGQVTSASGTRQVSGHAWLDREWSSSFLTEDQEGWDWLALRLEDGTALMLYRLRHEQGDDYLSGTWIDRQGRSHPLDTAQLTWNVTRQTLVSGRSLPLHWQLEIPAYGVSVQIEPLQTESWMELRYPYWEGPVSARGSHQAEGYLELTGY